MGALFTSPNTTKEPIRPQVNIVVEDVPNSTTVRNLVNSNQSSNLNKVVPYNSLSMGTTMQLNLQSINGPQGTSSNWHQSNNNVTSSQQNSLFSSTPSNNKSKKKTVAPRQTTQLMENDMVNIVYMEPGIEPQNLVKDLVQHQKFLVLPKTGLISADQKFMRVVRGPAEELSKKKQNTVYYVGLPNSRLPPIVKA